MMKTALLDHCAQRVLAGAVFLTGRFRRAADGVASVEFALVIPLMVTLFFGIVEFSEAMSANRKVNYAATMLVDLVSQEQFLSHDDIGGIYTAVEQVLQPYGIDNPDMWVASVTMDNSDTARVDWSLDDDLNEPFGRGSEFTALSEDKVDFTGEGSILDPGQSVIIAYIRYPYSPKLAQVILQTVTFTNHAVRWPRRTTQVVYCNAASECSDN